MRRNGYVQSFKAHAASYRRPGLACCRRKHRLAGHPGVRSNQHELRLGDYHWRHCGIHAIPHEDLLEDGGQAFGPNRRLRRRQNRLLALLQRIWLHHDGHHDVGRNFASRVWPGADVVHRLLLHRSRHRTRTFGRELPRALRPSQRRPRTMPR